LSCSVGYDAGIVKKLLPLLLLLSPLALGQTVTLFENDSVRVLKANAVPHQLGRLHEHAYNRVMIYLDAGTEDLAYEGGKVSKLAWKAGEVEWSPISGKHTSNITSDKAVGIVEIELKKPGAGGNASGPLDPLKVDPKHYKVEFENAQVRVIRAHLGPGESAPLHEHALNRVVTYLTPQNVKVADPAGKSTVATHKRGEASWGTPTKHTELNLNHELFEVIAVELK